MERYKGGKKKKKIKRKEVQLFLYCKCILPPQNDLVYCTQIMQLHIQKCLFLLHTASFAKESKMNREIHLTNACALVLKADIK